MLREGSHALLPEPVRGPAIGAIIVAAAVLGALSVLVAGEPWPIWLDLGVDRITRRPVTGLSFPKVMTWFGALPTVVVVAATTCIAALRVRRRPLAALALLGPGLTGLATTGLKPALGRTVGEGSWAFPSGHTAGATALGLTLAIAAFPLLRPGRRAALGVLACGALLPGTIAGVGLVLVRAHYPTDVVGGLATAIVVVLGTALMLDAAVRRWWSN
ncbi:MAG: phosphatase PAP2 family protein [Pseudonocardia sp.]|nr:phosphatase PAP2 family protein [Pseudonocardia sp.]